MSRVSGQVLSVSISEIASFLTRLRHNSSSSASLLAHGALRRSYSKLSSSLKSGSFSMTWSANLSRSRLRTWKRLKMSKAGWSSPVVIASSSS